MEAFMYSGLESFVFNEGLKQVSQKAFAHNVSLSQIEFSSTMNGLGESVFIGCSSLETIVLHPDNTGYILENGILFNTDRTEIVLYSPGKTDVTYTLPAYVQTIRAGAFSNTKLEEIIFNDLITHIPDNAFFEAKELISVTLPENITSAGESAFNSAISLESFHFPSHFEEISKSMLQMTLSLKEITFSEDLIRIMGFSFLQSGIEHIDLPHSVDYIGEWAFTACFQLDEVVLPDTLQTIDTYAFSHIESINIPSQLEKLGHKALAVANFEEIVLPDSATDVGEFIMETLYGKTRLIDFGNAKNVDLSFYNGSRLEAIILGENTQDAIFWGWSSKMINLYVKNSTTEITLKNNQGYSNYIITIITAN